MQLNDVLMRQPRVYPDFTLYLRQQLEHVSSSTLDRAVVAYGDGCSQLNAVHVVHSSEEAARCDQGSNVPAVE